MAAYRRRRVRELREMAKAVSYAHHSPDKIDEHILDSSELQDRAAARGIETDLEKYWED